MKHRERGAVLIWASFTMVVLVAISAIVIDLANARQWRRQAQNAADAAALAAAQDLPNTANAIARAKEYALLNFDTKAADWTSCRDDQALELTPDTAINNQCISFSPDTKQVRVTMPARRVPTFFGRMMQFDSFSIRASAVAALPTSSLDRIIPAAVAAPMGTGLICVEQGSANQPCSTRHRGQFGSLASPRLAIFKPVANSNQTSLAINYAMNIDHDITRFAGSGTRICDGAIISPCTASNVGTGMSANHLSASTGNDIPPVSEGYVTGFTAQTSDRGQVTFCGRLQRPDTTTANLLDPTPGGCATPGAPTMTILNRTVNGRHVYFWMIAAARQLFYPEVVALGYADTDQRLAIGRAIWTNGDRRLDCFVAGYRYNTATRTETLPDCSAFGLTYPTMLGPSWERKVADLFTNAVFNANDGNAPWLTNWTKQGNFSDSATTGGITISNGNLQFDLSGTNTGQTITRSLSMTESSGQLATAARLQVTTDVRTMGLAQVNLEVSNDGTTWTAVSSFVKQSTSGFTTTSIDVTPHISTNTRMRFTVAQTGNNSARFYVTDVSVTFGGRLRQPSPVAPIFRPEMRTDPRWAVIPRVDDFTSPSQAVPVTLFWGFYGYTAYASSTKILAFDAWVFDPSLLLANPATDTFAVGYVPESTYALVK